WQVPLLNDVGLGIDPADHVAKLADVPDRAVGRLDRIARALAELERPPGLGLDLIGARDDNGRPLVAGREGLGEGIQDELVLVWGGPELYHLGRELIPTGSRVAEAALDLADLVAGRTHALHQLLAGAIRKACLASRRGVLR